MSKLKTRADVHSALFGTPDKLEQAIRAAQIEAGDGQDWEYGNDAGRFDCAEILARIKEQEKPCFHVLDGAYQFSASIGLYVKE